ncbi:restriction endonuclease [Treponema vincentii]|uniref:restriction endonuclease n=1 Tax=Treponema vincentii TaxID=69710 RepID=UPI0020A3DB45|nr:restriction endonuclease [Treponema vincentii]UTC45323.1 restriction endonuclease [Treponema vincentii]
MKTKLTLEKLQEEVKIFSELESEYDETSIYGSTDGKAVGTYLEHKFKNFLSQKYDFDSGNSASGIDLPELEVDIKTTSIIQPQSSCPFKSARQKIFGLGYNLLVFVYKKQDNQQAKTSRLDILHTIFVSKSRTAGYQLTTSLNKILENHANKDDIIALFHDKNLPVDDILVDSLADEILSHKPEIGYLTISNALQWRLQYSRIIEAAGNVNGIARLV